MIDDQRFADVEQLTAWCDRLGAFGLRSSGSTAHNRAIEWIEGELSEIPGLQLRSDSFEISRWRPLPDATLGQAGTLQVGGRSIAVAGAVPYSLNADHEGDLVYLPPATAITPANARGKIVLRDFPHQPIPYHALLQHSLYLSPDGEELRGATYDRPGMADGVIHRDLIDAGRAGASGMVIGFDLPREQVAGYFEPHQGMQYRIPAVYVGVEDHQVLLRSAMEGHRGHLHVNATSDRAKTRNLFATLPGQTTQRLILVSHTDGNTWVQENGAAALLALARYFAQTHLEHRRRSIEFAFTSTHLHISREGSVRYARQLDARFDEGDVVCVLPLEHLGARELAPFARPGQSGRRLEFTGRPEPLLWAVGPSAALRKAAIDAAKGRQLERVIMVPGLGPAVEGRVPEITSFGGLGTNFHAHLIPTTSLITAPWSLWAPAFGRHAVDIALLRRQTLAAGDVIAALDAVPRCEVAGDYLAARLARAAGAPGGLGELPSEFAPA